MLCQGMDGQIFLYPHALDGIVEDKEITSWMKLIMHNKDTNPMSFIMKKTAAKLEERK